MSLKSCEEQRPIYSVFSQLVKSSIAATAFFCQGLMLQGDQVKKNLSPSGWEGGSCSPGAGGVKHKATSSDHISGKVMGYLGRDWKAQWMGVAVRWGLCPPGSRLDRLELGLRLRCEDLRLATYPREKCQDLRLRFWSETSRRNIFTLLPPGKKTILLEVSR